MNRVAQSIDSPGEDLDALLSAYFKAQMPKPWPTFRAPSESKVLPFRTPQKRRKSGWTSRLALAAGIALLLVGAALLPRPEGTMSADRPNPARTIGESTARQPTGKEMGSETAKPRKRTPEKAKSKEGKAR
jgi:hypothetical protein